MALLFVIKSLNTKNILLILTDNILVFEGRIESIDSYIVAARYFYEVHG